MIINSEYGNARLTAKQILTDPVLFLAFGFGSGLSPKAPGTCGTLAAVPLYYVIAPSDVLLYSLSTVLVCIAGIWLCGVAADKLGEHDFKGIVWDEIAGYLVTLWLIPFSWQVVVLGFVLFRFFDIIKPWPISWADRKIHGGLGIMLDDIMAGIMANLTLRLLLLWV